MAARARYPLNFAPAQSNQHYGAAGAAPQPINPRTHAIQPRDNRTAFGAANSSLKARYYNEVHDSTYEECMSLSIEAKNALRKRNETWMQPNLQFIGDRNIPDANWVHGDDFPKLTDEQIAALLQSLDGLEKGDKSEAVPAVGDKQCRVTFWKDRLQPLPRGMRAIKINCLEDLRPGYIGFLSDEMNMWHVALILTIDYLKGEMTVLIFFTYGGTGLEGRANATHLFGKPWHPDMCGEWKKARDGPNPPFRVDGPDDPKNGSFHSQFNDARKVYLRLWPEVHLRINRMVAIIGYVAPATLKWILEYVSMCKTIQLPLSYDSAVLHYRSHEIAGLMRAHTEERVKADLSPSDDSRAVIRYIDWRWVELANDDRNRSGYRDPIKSQWALSRIIPTFFVKWLERMLTTFDKLCDPKGPSPTGRETLGSMVSQSQEALSKGYRATLLLADEDDAVRDYLGVVEVASLKRYMTELEPTNLRKEDDPDDEI